MEEIYDVIIIGSGPAGMSAAIYAKRAAFRMAVVEKEYVSGGQIINTAEVDNYPGLPGMGGFDLAQKMREHCDRMGVDFITAEVTDISVGDIKTITFANGESIKAKNIIIATGARHRKLNVPGEEALIGCGVSYCATCDGAFYRGKDVVVVGGGDTAVEDAAYLARLCNKVYIVHRRDEFRAAGSLVTKMLALPNVEFVKDSVVKSINGKDVVESVTLTNVRTGEEREIEVKGIFIAVGIQPNSECFRGLVEMNDGGYIAAGEDCRTNVEGVFACGDVRTKALRQVVTAAADGANAIYSIS